MILRCLSFTASVLILLYYSLMARKTWLALSNGGWPKHKGKTDSAVVIGVFLAHFTFLFVGTTLFALAVK